MRLDELAKQYEEEITKQVEPLLEVRHQTSVMINYMENLRDIISTAELTRSIQEHGQTVAVVRRVRAEILKQNVAVLAAWNQTIHNFMTSPIVETLPIDEEPVSAAFCQTINGYSWLCSRQQGHAGNCVFVSNRNPFPTE